MPSSTIDENHNLPNLSILASLHLSDESNSFVKSYIDLITPSSKVYRLVDPHTKKPLLLFRGIAQPIFSLNPYDLILPLVSEVISNPLGISIHDNSLYLVS